MSCNLRKIAFFASLLLVFKIWFVYILENRQFFRCRCRYRWCDEQMDVQTLFWLSIIYLYGFWFWENSKAVQNYKNIKNYRSPKLALLIFYFISTGFTTSLIRTQNQTACKYFEILQNNENRKKEISDQYCQIGHEDKNFIFVDFLTYLSVCLYIWYVTI